MTTIPNGLEEKCTQCGSKAVNVEWDERVNAMQVQRLWRCLNCKNEFITQVASDEKPISYAEITKRFFTSLIVSGDLSQNSTGFAHERFFKRIFCTRHHQNNDRGDEWCNCYTSASGQFSACSIGR